MLFSLIMINFKIKKWKDILKFSFHVIKNKLNLLIIILYLFNFLIFIV